ncbi:hypothetical protein ACSBR2_038702 [Camellia fascicularis]
MASGSRRDFCDLDRSLISLTGEVRSTAVLIETLFEGVARSHSTLRSGNIDRITEDNCSMASSAESMASTESSDLISTPLFFRLC